jgi:hypothetical protein
VVVVTYVDVLHGVDFYRVRGYGQDLWVAFEGGDGSGVYAWIPNLHRFVYHGALGTDFYWDRELDWRPIEPEMAYTLAWRKEIGDLSQLRNLDLLEKLNDEQDYVVVGALLPGEEDE